MSVFGFALLVRATPCAAEEQPAAAGAAPKATVESNLPPVTPVAWGAAGIKSAKQLASKLKAVGVTPDNCEESTYGIADPQVRDRFPVPQAVLSCVGEAEEDVTIDIFAKPEEARTYVDVKREYLCRQAFNNKMWFYPGFPFVLAGSSLIEPDEKETAAKIADILEGQSGMADCTKQWETMKQTSKKVPATAK